jgi:hypothetical protein
MVLVSIKRIQYNIARHRVTLLAFFFLGLAVFWLWSLRSFDCPPNIDYWGTHSASYRQLRWIYSTHLTSFEHPFTMFWAYLAITIGWVIFAKGQQKLWGIVWALFTSLSFLALTAALGMCDGTRIHHLKSYREAPIAYHLFMTETVTSDLDVFFRSLYLARCNERDDQCEYRKLDPLDRLWKKIDWKINNSFQENSTLEVFVDNNVIYKHNLNEQKLSDFANPFYSK